MFAGARFPFVASLELVEPLIALRALAALPYPFLLHSSLLDGRARWSFFGADPFAVHVGEGYEQAVATWRALSARVLKDDAQPTLVPFTGGIVGYWAYDFGRRLERLPSLAKDDLGLPDHVLGFYDVIGAHDHSTRQTWLFSSGLPEDGEARVERARSRLERFEALLWGARRGEGPHPAERARVARPTFTADAYRRAVQAVQEHIRSGDLYQANLTQRWTVPVDGLDHARLGLDLIDALADLSPAPFSAYLRGPDHTIVSASPERFVELRGRHVEARPIKGTRPRGASMSEDERLARELQGSAKDRAENVMIVDVLRNDLGRVCVPGTVAAPSLCALESYAQVLHLTSTVVGRLADDRDAFDLLHAGFPGGSITGAPKIRAMELLDSLEPVRRHVYTGSIGYVDWRGEADWNIAIRTALLTPHGVHMAAGGGITADSDPDEELAETLHKIEGLRIGLSRVLAPIELGTGAVHA